MKERLPGSTVLVRKGPVRQTIIVPDAHLLFTGDFKRSGVDLVLTGDDRELVLHDYFKGEKRAALSSPEAPTASVSPESERKQKPSSA